MSYLPSTNVFIFLVKNADTKNLFQLTEILMMFQQEIGREGGQTRRLRTVILCPLENILQIETVFQGLHESLIVVTFTVRNFRALGMCKHKR